ncbi:hypothetical protein DFH09DRAFT_1409562 [Mycena vulgaris]|nr:hypothetical protein DFH09DRAFT_1409562 [Mycena vulgaris]
MTHLSPAVYQQLSLSLSRFTFSSSVSLLFSLSPALAFGSAVVLSRFGRLALVFVSSQVGFPQAAIAEVEVRKCSRCTPAVADCSSSLTVQVFPFSRPMNTITPTLSPNTCLTHDSVFLISDTLTYGSDCLAFGFIRSPAITPSQAPLLSPVLPSSELESQNFLLLTSVPMITVGKSNVLRTTKIQNEQHGNGWITNLQCTSEPECDIRHGDCDVQIIQAKTRNVFFRNETEALNDWRGKLREINIPEREFFETLITPRGMGGFIGHTRLSSALPNISVNLDFCDTPEPRTLDYRLVGRIPGSDKIQDLGSRGLRKVRTNFTEDGQTLDQKSGQCRDSWEGQIGVRTESCCSELLRTRQRSEKEEGKQ